MTALDLAPILALANAAEDGPWRAVEHPQPDDSPDGWPLITIQSESGDRREVAAVIEDDVASASEKPRENAKFIAAARTLVPAMADEIVQLRAELAEARAQRDRFYEQYASAQQALRSLAQAYTDATGKPAPEAVNA